MQGRLLLYFCTAGESIMRSGETGSCLEGGAPPLMPPSPPPPPAASCSTVHSTVSPLATRASRATTRTAPGSRWVEGRPLGDTGKGVGEQCHSLTSLTVDHTCPADRCLLRGPGHRHLLHLLGRRLQQRPLWHARRRLSGGRERWRGPAVPRGLLSRHLRVGLHV